MKVEESVLNMASVLLLKAQGPLQKRRKKDLIAKYTGEIGGICHPTKKTWLWQS